MRSKQSTHFHITMNQCGIVLIFVCNLLFLNGKCDGFGEIFGNAKWTFLFGIHKKNDPKNFVYFSVDLTGVVQFGLMCRASMVLKHLHRPHRQHRPRNRTVLAFWQKNSSTNPMRTLANGHHQKRPEVDEIRQHVTMPSVQRIIIYPIRTNQTIAKHTIMINQKYRLNLKAQIFTQIPCRRTSKWTNFPINRF